MPCLVHVPDFWEIRVERTMTAYQKRNGNAGVFNRALGNRLRTFRQERNLSQSTVAQAVGVTFQQIQKYERGVNRVTAERILALCCILDVTPLELLGWESGASCKNKNNNEMSGGVP